VRREKRTDEQVIENLKGSSEGKVERKKSWGERATMAIAKMSHEAAAVAFVEKTGQRFGECISRIDFSRQVT
jgi:hypothetical protein